MSEIGDLGLISILPTSFLFALAVLAATFVWLACTAAPTPLLSLNLIAFVVLAHALGAFLESQPAGAVTWLHMGFTDYVAQTGQVAPGLDARFDWPGFFDLAAFLTLMTGIDLRSMALVSNGTFALLDLLPLAAIGLALTRNRTLIWLSLLVFSLGNWIGQEYFSPQALAFFLYLTVLAAVLTWFRRPGNRPGLMGSLPPVLTTPIQRGVLLAVVSTLVLAIVVGHQLTPFMLLATLTALWLTRRLAVPTAIALVAAMIVTWLGYAAWPFVSGHLVELLAGLGGVTSNLGSNVASRVAGSADHQLVVKIRVLFSMSFLLVAAIWFIRRWRHGHREVAIAALAAAPWPLIALNPYGGEMILRAEMFALPFVSIMVAAGVLEALAWLRRWQGAVLVCVVAACMTSGFIISRYGNERLDMMRPTELQAVEMMYSLAPANSLLLAPSGNLPWRYQSTTTFEYVSDLPITGGSGDLGVLLTAMTSTPHPAAFLIFTTSEGAYQELFAGVSRSAWQHLQTQVADSGLFKVVYSNADAVVYRLSAADGG